MQKYDETTTDLADLYTNLQPTDFNSLDFETKQQARAAYDKKYSGLYTKTTTRTATPEEIETANRHAEEQHRKHAKREQAIEARKAKIRELKATLKRTTTIDLTTNAARRKAARDLYCRIRNARETARETFEAHEAKRAEQAIARQAKELEDIDYNLQRRIYFTPFDANRETQLRKYNARLTAKLYAEIEELTQRFTLALENNRRARTAEPKKSKTARQQLDEF